MTQFRRVAPATVSTMAALGAVSIAPGATAQQQTKDGIVNGWVKSHIDQVEIPGAQLTIKNVNTVVKVARTSGPGHLVGGHARGFDRDRRRGRAGA